MLKVESFFFFLNDIFQTSAVYQRSKQENAYIVCGMFRVEPISQLHGENSVMS